MARYPCESTWSILVSPLVINDYVACTRTRDYLLLCGTYDIDIDEMSAVALGEANDFDDASRWRDWLQSTLFRDGALLAEVIQTGETQANLGDASYTLCVPQRPVEWRTDDTEAETTPSITLPSPPDQPSATRVAATTLVNAVADASGTGHSTTLLTVRPD